MERIKVLHEPSGAEPFVILKKPSGIPSAPIASSDCETALDFAERLFPKIKYIHGKKEIETGLLHRIDTATEGLLLIAENQDFYDYIISVQQKGFFLKNYSALCRLDDRNAEKLGGFPKLPLGFSSPECLAGASAESFFRPYGKGGKEVRPVLEESSRAALKKTGSKKVYRTKILSVADAPSMPCGGESAAVPLVKVAARIATGFRHQVRCHLSWLGLPVEGDALYNYDFRSSGLQGKMFFFADGLEFPDLYSDKIFRFNLEIDWE